MIELFTWLLSKDPMSRIWATLRACFAMLVSLVTFLLIIYLIPFSWLISPPSWLAFPVFVIFSLIGFGSVGGFYALGLIKPKKKMKTTKSPKMKA